ncbi:MAG: Uma2 family endonuclease [Solirubrobacteraceae bacterium]
MSVDAPPITADQLFEMPDDGLRHELVAGELSTITPPGFEHGEVALAIGSMLREHARSTGAGKAVGEVGFLIERAPDTVRAPDAAFVARERIDATGPLRRYWPGAPDLAVEVVSPGDSFRAVEEKARQWLAAGAVAVLVIEPARRTATVYRAGDRVHVHGVGEMLELDDAVPGFSAPVAELFD